MANAASVGIKEVNGDPVKGTCVEDGLLNPFCISFDSNGEGAPYYLVILFLFLMYFWSASLLHAFNTYTVAYAAGVWYFSDYDSSGTKDLPGGNTFCDCKLLFAGFMAGVKQLGSLGFGSLIMAICKLILLLTK